MGFYKAVYHGEVVASGWARDEQEFSALKKLAWYHENGGFEIVGGY
jgi:hypothetical protein